MVTQIEYHLSVMVGAVLIPFGMFGPTAFLTEFCIGWITGGLLRVLVTAVLVGIGLSPLQHRRGGHHRSGQPHDLQCHDCGPCQFASMRACAGGCPTRPATMCGRVALGLSGAYGRGRGDGRWRALPLAGGADGAWRVPDAAERRTT